MFNEEQPLRLERESKVYSTDYTQNREFSWLKFNKRVLDEADEKRVPLAERLKFVAIFTSNLDEFFMVRVGGLLNLAAMTPKKRDNKSMMTAGEQLQGIFEKTKELYRERDRIYSYLRHCLTEKGIGHVLVQEMTKKQYALMEEVFHDTILPVLSPQIIDKHHPFPHLDSKKLYVSAMLKGKKKFIFGIIPLPSSLNRVVYLSKERIEFVLLEDIIEEFIGKVFTGYPVVDKAVFSITRSADITIEDDGQENEDYLDAMRQALKKRNHLTPVRLEVQSRGKSLIAEYLMEHYKISPAQVFFTTVPLSLDYVYGLDANMTESMQQELYYLPYEPPAWEEKFGLERDASLLQAVQERDLLLHYPYDNFACFLRLIKEAAYSPDVMSIKITIYRVGTGHVKLMNYLMAAAELGKDVTVLLELQARFDEENNISWVNSLREAGCRILYGIAKYKVHAKVCQITFRGEEGNGVKYITHIGTGNFNAKTAKIYTDFSLLTANDAIGRDAATFFRNMGIGNLWGEYQHLLVAPVNMKKHLLELLQAEADKVAAGQEGYVLLKMNSLTDRELIDALYEANRAGVKIDMIVRGITCLVPQRAGLTENIRICSLVGRFLEHARVFCFGKKEQDMKMYIGSADWMTRNTENRVEVATPIFDEAVKQEIWDVLQLQLADNVNRRVLDADGEYRRPVQEGQQELIDAQARCLRH